MNKLLLIIFRYFRYLFSRYVKTGAFSSYELLQGIFLHRCIDLKESFFGYYNLSPQNISNEVLACVPHGKQLDIFIINSNKAVKISETYAWNWQQGAMLQWSPKNENVIYFNDYCPVEEKYITKVVNLKIKGFNKILPLPISCIAKDESYALSLNFERLAIMRPEYGYFNKDNIVLPNHEDDGIWKINLKTKEYKLIISIKTIMELSYVSNMTGAKHKVNHIDIAPNGERFMFLHRWESKGGRNMRLITADKDGKDIYILNGDRMTSHSCWWNSDKIISFCHTLEFDDNYVIFNDKSGVKEKLSNKLPSEDGHPSISPDGRWLITDTYPSYDRISRLILYNIEYDECFDVGRFFQPLKYKGSYRIDLHPKWNLNGTEVFFESGHSGYRNLYSINIDKIISNL